jgi:pimeloyl-ACP methyl ester carboxylesterase
MNVPSTTHHIHSQGIELAVEAFGEGIPVIFAHGLGGNREISRQQWLSICDCYRVIVFDQRGHGQSSPILDAGRYDPRQMGEDILSIMDALEIPHAIVGGVSMGACTSLHFAGGHPDRTLALLQIGPAFTERPNPAHREYTRIGGLLECEGIEATIAEISNQWLELGMPQEAIAEMTQLYRSYHPDSMALAFQTIPQWTISEDLLDRLMMPVGIIAWKDDPIHDFEIAREMERKIRQASLIEIPGVFTPDLGQIFHSQFLSRMDISQESDGWRLNASY